MVLRLTNNQKILRRQGANVVGSGIANATGLAQNFAYYGLSANTYINFGDNPAFVGSIYAPEAYLATIRG